jgi:hypothetical protein
VSVDDTSSIKIDQGSYLSQAQINRVREEGAFHYESFSDKLVRLTSSHIPLSSWSLPCPLSFKKTGKMARQASSDIYMSCFLSEKLGALRLEVSQSDSVTRGVSPHRDVMYYLDSRKRDDWEARSITDKVSEASCPHTASLATCA